MNKASAFFCSSIGRKVVMAVTGLILFGFVVVHMLGNLQVYLGPTKLDEYGRLLRTIPELLWAARLVLIGSAAAHIWAAVSLTLDNSRARPVGYRTTSWRESTWGSRTMRYTGFVLLAFIVFHILHFTIGLPAIHPDFREGAVNHNFVTGFMVPWASAFYIAATLCLGLHLYHGAWSFLQSLGLSHPKYDALRMTLAGLLTAAVVAGNISFPVAVLAGIVREAAPAAAALPGVGR